MARGWESKAVEEQRATERFADLPAAGRVPVGDEDSARRHRELELLRSDVQRRLAEAQAERYRDMLRRTLEAIEAELDRTP